MSSNHGGRREGAGRKATGRKSVAYWITLREKGELDKKLKELRSENMSKTIPDCCLGCTNEDCHGNNNAIRKFAGLVSGNPDGSESECPYREISDETYYEENPD
jgi:hypothetical protein